MTQAGYYSPWADAAGAAGGVGGDLAHMMLGIAQMKSHQRQLDFQNNIALQELQLRQQENASRMADQQAQIPVYQAHAQLLGNQNQNELAMIAARQMEQSAAQSLGAKQARQLVPSDPILAGRGPTAAGGAQLDARDNMQSLVQLIAMHNPEALINMHNVGANQVGQDFLGRKQAGPITLTPGESYQADASSPQTLNTNWRPAATGAENDVALINGLTHFLGQATQMNAFGDEPLHPELQGSEAYTNAIPLLNSLIQGQSGRVAQKYGGATNQAPVQVTPPQQKTAPVASIGDSFDSEQLARKAGKRAGDVITLKGVGKVRLR